jgi:hypothetical protein
MLRNDGIITDLSFAKSRVESSSRPKIYDYVCDVGEKML